MSGGFENGGFGPEVQDFLRRIVLSIVLGVIWLVVNMTIGIFFEWMFFEGRPSTGNYIYYTFFLVTLGWYVWVLSRMWKKRFPHG
jgi:hypothetical protein